MTTVHMIGHSTLPIDQFIGLLQMHSIKLLLDVRTKPASRWNPQFGMGPLKASLESVGILYGWRPALGGKEPLPSNELKLILEPLLPELPKPLCLMCSEGDFKTCHRHYLLAPVILDLGYNILQIQKDGSVMEDTGPSEKTLKKFAPHIPERAELPR